MIIISDIHGRTFWNNSLSEKGILQGDSLTDDVIFMGDYLDHYNGEPDPNQGNTYITDDSEFKNFKEILKFKKTFPDKVVLLLGNHDMEYITTKCVPCRMNYFHSKEISELFKENIKLFKFGTYTTLGDRLITFSHANICPDWIESIYPIEVNKTNGISSCKLAINTLNDMLLEDNPSFDAIGDMVKHVGYGRGGDYPVGSIVWSDLRDYTSREPLWEDVYQVVAHTQHLVENNRFIYDENTFCTDCHIAALGNRPLFKLGTEWKPLGTSKIDTCLEIL